LTIGPGAFAGIAAENVRPLAGRVGADNHEIGRLTEVAVGGAGRQEGDVAGGEIDGLAIGAAEPDGDAAAADAEDLVSGGVVMVVVEDAVPPGALPAMVAEGALDGLDAAGDGVSPEQHRQAGV